MAMNKSLEKFLRKKKRTGKDVINYQTIFEEELENLRRYCNGSGLVQESELIEDVTPAKKFWEHLYPELAAPARYYQLSVREYLIKKVD